MGIHTGASSSPPTDAAGPHPPELVAKAVDVGRARAADGEGHLHRRGGKSRELSCCRRRPAMAATQWLLLQRQHCMPGEPWLNKSAWLGDQLILSALARMLKSQPPQLPRALTSVPPSGMAYTLPPSCRSHPATIRPACAWVAGARVARERRRVAKPWEQRVGRTVLPCSFTCAGGQRPSSRNAVARRPAPTASDRRAPARPPSQPAPPHLQEVFVLVRHLLRQLSGRGHRRLLPELHAVLLQEPLRPAGGWGARE